MKMIISLLLAGAALGQTFEVVSVKTSKADNLNMEIRSNAPGAITASNVTLQTMMRVSYQVSNNQIIGPAWLTKDRFDIKAIGAGTANRLKDMPEALQALLADRFQLRVHTEERITSVVALRPAPKGIRIQPSAEGDGRLQMTRRALDGLHVSMDQVVKALSDMTGQIIVDQSGLTGFFDIHIKWFPDGEEAKDDSPPGLYTVLRDELGLVARSGKAPIKVIVVDRAEKPGEN